MTFSHKILVGLALGILVGLFFGEDALALKWAADGFVKLLQMTVLPYVTVSIVESLGSLQAAEARRLGLRGGAVLAALWAIGLFYAMLVPLTFPTVETAAFFSTTLLERRPPFNFVDLYIPANPFYSLANNVVPAVVLFSIILGIAVIGLERKAVLLDLLKVASGALSRATRFIVQLTPYGLFAIAATAAGTLSLEQLGRLQVFLVSYVGVSLLVSLWVLPGLVAALTPIRARDIFALTGNAPDYGVCRRRSLHRAAGADRIEPNAHRACRRRRVAAVAAGRHRPGVVQLPAHRQAAVDQLRAVRGMVFRFPCAAPAVSAAGADRIGDVLRQRQRGGSVSPRRVPHPGGHVPAVRGERRLQLALRHAGRGDAHAGGGPARQLRHGRHAALAAPPDRAIPGDHGILTVALIGGARMLFGRAVNREDAKDKVLAGMHLLHQPVEAVVHRTPLAATTEERGPRLDVIRRRGVLSVGYLDDSLPYAFFNAAGDLVGLDVELAHRLASELQVRLEFVAINRDRLVEAVENGECDLVMSGVVVTTVRASQLVFSEAYVDETLAFIVLDDRRTDFMSWEQLRARPGIRIGIPQMPYYVQKIKERLPQADVRLITAVTPFFVTNDQSGLDALAFAAERGSAWTLMYPQFSVAIPEPDLVKVPLAYPVGGGDQAFARFLNTWIELKRKDGTIDGLYRYWILGQDAAPKQPRWSIIRNVLHWTK